MRISDWGSDVCSSDLADFISMGFNQVVNNLAKSHYRGGQPAGVVIRMPTGAGTGAGPFHSQSTEAWFIKTPGLKVVYPAFPEDAKGLLAAAVEDPNPVLFFEHKHLYRTRSEEHTSELQSLMRISYAVFCLKKTTNNYQSTHTNTNNTDMKP